MKKEKTINLAARMMAEARWKGVTDEEPTAYAKRIAQVPRTAKRCFCGASSMWTAANRYFDCCRKAGVIILNLNTREQPQT
jgi:hypothetical protein